MFVATLTALTGVVSGEGEDKGGGKSGKRTGPACGTALESVSVGPILVQARNWQRS